MRRSPVLLREHLHLDPTSEVPLHRQIYLWMRRAILEGQLQPGQRLPSTRQLSSELGVSRNTASSAYEELQAEEFILRTVGSGTIVSRVFSEQRPVEGVTAARHLRRMRTLYAARRQFLLTAIEHECGSLLTAQPPEAGLHLVGWLPPGIVDTEVEQRAKRRGIEALALSRTSRRPLFRSGLGLGYATGNERDIQAGVKVLADTIRSCL